METLKSMKNWLLVLIDIFLINISFMTALYFRFTYGIPKTYLNNYKTSAFAITLLYLLVFFIFRLYESLWTYAGIDEYLLVTGASIISGCLALLYGNFIGPSLPLTVNILAGIFSAILVCGFRISLRLYRRVVIILSKHEEINLTRVMVIGAGQAGVSVVREMKNNSYRIYKPVVLIDDSRFKQGTIISNVKVEGKRNDIERLAKKHKVEMVLIAIPSLDNENRKEIIDICKRTGCRIKILPAIQDLISGKVSLNEARDVDVEDLLGRDAVKLEMEGIADYINENTILVTGGGGSIGSELCRQIARFEPRQLLILDIYENNAYDLQNELRHKYPDLNLKVIIASVRDKNRLNSIFKEYKPEIVFHAAAHKHVPLMEENPTEAIKNNVFGTLNLAETSDKYGTKRFVLISTDKAVNPTNIMGATKRLCEMVIQSMNSISETQFVAVRFGNVLGSNGSVIPLFKKQITHGGPVTVTHKEITRFFMTIPEAAQLVLQAGAYAEGGEIFVLDMGKPVKIYDLACDLIRLSGFEPNKDIMVEITGLRPGEKLYEELLMDEEGLSETRHEKIFIGRPTYTNINELRRDLKELYEIVERMDKMGAVIKVKQIVPTYRNGVQEEAAITRNKTQEVAVMLNEVQAKAAASSF